MLIADHPQKPRFYNLGPADYSNQDTPKIDGLVRSTLLISLSAFSCSHWTYIYCIYIYIVDTELYGSSNFMQFIIFHATFIVALIKWFAHMPHEVNILVLKEKHIIGIFQMDFQDLILKRYMRE